MFRECRIFLISFPSVTSNLPKFQSIRHFQSGKERQATPLLFFLDSLSNWGLNRHTLSVLLKNSARYPDSLSTSKIVTYLVKSALINFTYVGTSLLTLLAKHGCVNQARNVFDHMPVKDVVAWNAMISGYSKNGLEFYAWKLFVQMRKQRLSPNQTTVLSIISSAMIEQGVAVHCFAIKSSLHQECEVNNALISMYGKSGLLYESEVLFQELKEKTLVSWNTMVGVYNLNGMMQQALIMFKKMVELNLEVNMVTVINHLSSKADPKLTHCYSLKTGLDNETKVITSLICSYARSGYIEAAEILFSSSEKASLVSLTAITQWHAEKGNVQRVIECYNLMQLCNMKMDSVSLISIFHAFSDPKDQNLGLCFHGSAIKLGLNNSTLVSNSMITMYFRFCDMSAAFSLFGVMKEKPLITWNSMISGFVQSGNANDALLFFCQMRDFGECPDRITLASLLSACSQVGLLRFGQNLHNYALKNLTESDEFVDTALIDMYSKCGALGSAMNVFNYIESPCLAMRNTMISGFSWYGREEEAFGCFSRMQEDGIHPDEITFLGLLAACAHGGYMAQGIRFMRLMGKGYDVKQTLQHYALMVGLIGREGMVEEALALVNGLEMKGDCSVWGALLSGCCIHQQVKIGECVASKMLRMDHFNGGFYILMSSLYAAVGRWDDVAMVRELMCQTGRDGSSGVSQIQLCS